MLIKIGEGNNSHIIDTELIIYIEPHRVSFMSGVVTQWYIYFKHTSEYLILGEKLYTELESKLQSTILLQVTKK